MAYKSQHSGSAIDKAVTDIQGVDLNKLNHYLGLFSDYGTRPRGKSAGDYCYVGIATDCDEFQWNGSAWTLTQTHVNLIGEVNNIVQELGDNPRVAVSQQKLSQVIADIIAVDEDQSLSIERNLAQIQALQLLGETLTNTTDSHSTQLEQHRTELDSHQIELDDHSEVLEQHRTELDEHQSNLDTLNLSSEDYSERIARLEVEKLRYKGVFASASLLPVDAVLGDYAYVGADTTALEVYTFNGSAWAATGEQIDLATVTNIDNEIPETPSESRVPSTALLKTSVDTIKQETDSKLTELEQRTDFVSSNNIIFEGNVVTIDARVIRKGVVNTIVGTYTFEQSSYLVLHKNNSVEIVIGSGNIKKDDIVLLYYNVDEGFIGGVFYTDYIKSLNFQGVYSKEPIEVVGTKATITSISFKRAAGTSATRVFANEDQTSKTFDIANGQCIVVDKDNQLIQRAYLKDIAPSDILLLYYDITIGRFVAGALYEHINRNKITELEKRTDFVSFNKAEFDGNTATIDARVIRNGVIAGIGGTYTFEQSSYLVLHKNNSTEIIIGSENIKKDDIVLLYYSSADGFIGGEFYAAYVKSKTDAILPNVKKYVSTRGAVYEKFNTLANVTLNTLFVFDADGTSATKVEDSTKWVLNASNRYLVLDGNNVLATRSQSSQLLPTDLVLLYADLVGSNINIKGGVLYADYLAFTQDELEKRTDFISSNNIIFEGNVVTIDARVIRNGVIAGIGGTYTFEQSSYLVLHKNNSTEIIIGSENIKKDDIILLYYNVDKGFIGGVFYTDYIKSLNFQGVYSRTITFVDDNTIELTSIFLLENGGPAQQIYASELHTPVRYAFGSGNANYLVLDKNKKIVQRNFSSDILKTDHILLVYDNTLSSFISGDLYLQYLSSQNETRDKPENLGVFNTIRKAHQMTDVQWVAAAPIEYNVGTYKEGSINKGVIYSSVKELNQFVNEDISMHTFMTALHNPKSIIYKERADVSPLHGKNCRAYYGTVCSGLVGYAMGIKTNFRTYDFVVADFMEKVKGQDIYNLKLGDFLWRPGHTGIVTDIYRDKYGVPTKVEICEALQTGCTRYFIKGSALQELINSTVDTTRWEFYRNKNLADNIEYTPCTDFVAVEGEQLTPFNYNDDIITYKGDKSLYINGEDVKLLIREDFASLGYTSIQLFKDDSLVNTLNITSSEMSLSNLEYGAYKSRLVNADGTYSDFTYWKVIDVDVRIDRDANRVYFSSGNSTPLYFEFCNIAGFRSEEYKEDTIHIFTEDELREGSINVVAPSTIPDSAGRIYTYIKVHFQDEYGRVINAPLEWYS